MSEHSIARASLSEEIVSNMSKIALLDKAGHSFNNFGTPLKELQAAQDTAVNDIENSFRDVPTADLSSDRLDLLSTIAVGELGTTSAELFAKQALINRIEERRKLYIERQHGIGKLMRGGNQYFAVTPLVDDIVKRTGWSTTSPSPEPIYKDYTLYMRTFRNRSVDIFTVWPTAKGSRDSNKSGRNYNGYSMYGVAQRSIGNRGCDVSLVDLDGNPLVSIVPLNGKPPRVPAPAPHYL